MGKTGELEFMKEMWLKMPHSCFICNKPLVIFSPKYMAHILPKSTYPELCLNEMNMVIMCGIHHPQWDQERHTIDPTELNWRTLIQLDSLLKQYNKDWKKINDIISKAHKAD